MVSPTENTTCLIIPCFNEAERLNIELFKTAGPDCYFLFVNDGSTDGTHELICRNQTDHLFYLRLGKNSGKAEAVRRGMLYLHQLPFFDAIRWVGYWDADLSTPLMELPNFFLYKSLYSSNPDAVWGSRVSRMGSNIKRSFLRHYFGRLFTTFTSTVLHLPCYDSQCGAKIFKKELIAEIFAEPFISRWIFDVEILLRMKDRQIIEYPLQYWQDVRGSKIKFIRVTYRTVLEVFKIRRKYLSRTLPVNNPGFKL
jgi:glycosyltransferase involved in cell wall biosynthesis